jgi:hypothetical protein
LDAGYQGDQEPFLRLRNFTATYNASVVVGQCVFRSRRRYFLLQNAQHT